MDCLFFCLGPLGGRSAVHVSLSIRSFRAIHGRVLPRSITRWHYHFHKFKRLFNAQGHLLSGAVVAKPHNTCFELYATIPCLTTTTRQLSSPRQPPPIRPLSHMRHTSPGRWKPSFPIFSACQSEHVKQSEAFRAVLQICSFSQPFYYYSHWML
jgi:hypothetical protein